MVLDWLFEGQNAARLGKGLLLTAQISLISVALSCVFGTLFGLMLRADNRIVRFIGRLYLETVRIVPILVWLFGLLFRFRHLDGVSISTACGFAFGYSCCGAWRKWAIWCAAHWNPSKNIRWNPVWPSV